MTLVQSFDVNSFRQAMSSFPSGVTVVTTTDSDGVPWGFTASAFCSVSAEPPLVLVCLSSSAQCHDAFITASEWAINIIHADQIDLAMRFATRGADKFEGDHFAHDRGIPELSGAAVTMRCSRHAIYEEGDHIILVGQVREARTNEAEEPVVYFRREFVPLRALSAVR